MPGQSLPRKTGRSHVPGLVLLVLLVFLVLLALHDVIFGIGDLFLHTLEEFMKRPNSSNEGEHV